MPAVCSLYFFSAQLWSKPFFFSFFFKKMFDGDPAETLHLKGRRVVLFLEKTLGQLRTNEAVMQTQKCLSMP